MMPRLDNRGYVNAVYVSWQKVRKNRWRSLDARWINTCEREPAQNREMQVIVVQSSGDGAYDLEYASTTLTERGWKFVGIPRFTKVVAIRVASGVRQRGGHVTK